MPKQIEEKVLVHSTLDVSGIPDKLLKKRYVTFDLPFLIMVEDGFTEENLAAYMTLHQVDYKPDNLTTPYEAHTDLGNIKIWFLKRSSKMFDKTHTSEFFGSMSKNLTYTSVLVEFSKESNKTQIDRDFCRSAMYGLNAFLEHYREIADKPYIPHLSVYTVGLFYILNVYDDGECFHIPITRQYENPKGLSEILNKEQSKLIRDNLRKSVEPVIYSRINSEIWYKLLTEDFRLAAIDSAILLETWVRKNLEDAYTAKGLSKTKMKLKFLTEDGKPMGIGEILEKLFLDARGFDFKATKEYQEVVDITLRKRNKLVHGVMSDITGREAHECYYKVMAAIKCIQDNSLTD